MASVPLAALAVQPVQQPDLLGNYGKLVALKGLMQQQQYQQQMQPLQLQQAQGALQLQQLQTQEAQRTLERNQAMDTAFSNAYTVDAQGNPTINKQHVYDYLSNNNAGSLIPELDAKFAGLDKTRADTQKALADTQKAQGETQLAGNNFLGAMGTAIKAANYDPVVAAHVLGQAVALGGPYASQAKDMLTHIQQNPQNIQQLTDEMIAASPQAVESQLKQVQTQTAATELPVKKAEAQELIASGLTPSQFKTQVAANTARAEAQARLGSEMTLANYNKQLAQQNIIYEHQLNGITDAFTNPQHGYSQTLSQIQATKNAIASAKTGNELAASMAPVMTALGVTSFAGIHRVPPAEVQAAGPAVGSVFRQIDAKLEKWGEGKLAPGTAQEMSSLMDDLLNAKYNTVLGSAKLAAANGHIPQDKVFVMDKLGQTIPLSQAQASQGTATGNRQIDLTK